MEVLNDFNTSVEKSLSEIDENWRNYEGLIVCGTHSPKNWEEQIEKIKKAREGELPYLGICFGHQLAAIEYAVNVLGNKYATSEEFLTTIEEQWNRDGKNDFVVKKRKEGLKVGLHDGESFWNNYEIVEGFESIWKKAPNFITVQYHPEYQSSISSPHPILVKFIKACYEKR